MKTKPGSIFATSVARLRILLKIAVGEKAAVLLLLFKVTRE